MIKYLLEIDEIEVGDSVLYAIKTGQVELMLMLLQRQGNSEFSPPAESPEFPVYITPLILAAEYGRYEIVALLLSRGHIIPRPHNPKCICSQECL
jgi:transient receptor potential cation channel subfamily C protein 4